jgi:hypothetical protein
MLLLKYYIVFNTISFCLFLTYYIILLVFYILYHFPLFFVGGSKRHCGLGLVCIFLAIFFLLQLLARRCHVGTTAAYVTCVM